MVRFVNDYKFVTVTTEYRTNQNHVKFFWNEIKIGQVVSSTYRVDVVLSKQRGIEKNEVYFMSHEHFTPNL